MNFDYKLYEAISIPHEIDMTAVLKEMHAAGMPRREAEEALQRLCDRLGKETRVKDEDLATEYLMITQNWCREEYRIWPLD